MFSKIIKVTLPLVLLITFGISHADDSLFNTNLFAKFQVKACTTCHDFYEQDKNGLAFTTHAKRLDVNRCKSCHKERYEC